MKALAAVKVALCQEGEVFPTLALLDAPQTCRLGVGQGVERAKVLKTLAGRGGGF